MKRPFPIAAAIAITAIALTSCKTAQDTTGSGEDDPEATLGRSPRDMSAHQMDTMDKIHDQSLRR